MRDKIIGAIILGVANILEGVSLGAKFIAKKLEEF
jgi:heme oxygenase